MNYFLHYNNAVPLFIGGHSHGQKFPVEDHYRFYRLPVPSDSPRFSLSVETYRREIFVADGRRFHIFVHEPLTPSAALMLMFGTVAESSQLNRRIQELERENAILKEMLAELSSH